MYQRERWLLSALLLLGFLAGGRSELQYLMTTPALLPGGETGRACVNIQGNEEQLDVRLIFQHDGQNTTILGEDVSSSDYFQCANYQIPNTPNNVPVTLLLSAKGQNTEILDRKTVVIQSSKSNCIFQMDKPIYRPGQKMRCRIICLNSELKPVDQKFTVVRLRDPSYTIIKQWTNQETQHGVLQLEFFLIFDGPVGYYNILAERESSYSISQGFRVEEYVPPRFSVNVEAPDTISVLDDKVPVKVSADYTYGEPVTGTVVVSYCIQSGLYGRSQNCLKEKGEHCDNIVGKLGQDGPFIAEIAMSGQFTGSTGRSMQIDVTVIEEGTEVQIKENRYVWVTAQPAKLAYDYEVMHSFYRRNIPFRIVARLSDEKDNPLPGQEIEIEVDNILVQTVKTDADGRIEYEFDTHDMVEPNRTILISYKNPDQCYYATWLNADYPKAEYTIFRFNSESDSFLQAKRLKGELNCGQSKDIEVQYTFGKDAIEGATAVKIYFLVKAKSRLVYNGQQDLDLTSSRNGTMTITLPVSADMAPSANLIVYCLLKKEIVVETLSLNIEKCFKNKVDMALSAEQGPPGSTVEVVLSADPESICGLKMIDYSLLLLNSYDNFSPDSIHGLFSYWYSGYHVGGFNLEDPQPACLDPNKLVFFNGNYYVPRTSDSDGDSYQNLKDVGLIVATKLHVRQPKVCDYNRPSQSKHPIPLESGGPHIATLKASADRVSGFGGGANPVTETLRSDFSETFLWLMLLADKDGHASVSSVAPDTITKWQGSAFCLSEEGGFGMVKYPVNYTTVLRFFVEVTTPNDMIRGELLYLSAVVHNDLDYFVKVQVTLGSSDAFNAEMKAGTQDVCVGPKGKAPFAWDIDANRLGDMNITVTAQTTFIGQSCDGPNDDSLPFHKDTVVKSIFTRPEGIQQERTLSNLIYVKPGTKSQVFPVGLTLPDNVVPDSASAFVTGIGDSFGLILENLLGLVKQPTGCGEQVLSGIAPISETLDYLNSTNQLTDEIREKGKRYILEGYIRFLQYASGSAYKIFRSAEAPNPFLTAYGFRILERAKRWVDIDETRQQQTLIWLGNLQRLDNGCFKTDGSMFTFQDTNSDLHFTANLAIALMNSKYSMAKTLLQGALECLKNASTTDQKIGDAVLVLHALTRANLITYSDHLHAKLMKKAVVKDGVMHWERENMPAIRPVSLFFPQYSSAEEMLTAYMLLTLIEKYNRAKSSGTGNTKSSGSNKDLTTMAQIATWLARRQNSVGGCSCPQSTAVVIQALAAYARMIYTPNSQHTIVIKNGNGNVGTLTLNPDNRLEVQRKDLPDPRGNYNIEVTGTGWFLFQVTTIFNIPVPKENSAFALTLSTKSDKCISGVAKVFNVSVELSYRGPRAASGMTIITIKMLSGYRADAWTLRELENLKAVSKYFVNPKGDVELYMDSVSKETPVAFQFRVDMGSLVLNVKRASGYVFDGYDPVENGYASYEHPCAKQA